MRAIVALLLAFCLSSFALADSPNIVVILVDDMGWGEIEPFGATRVKTPNLNAMAAEGMRFTSWYGAPRCSASRASLMTGCYNARVSIPGSLEPTGDIGLHPNEVTLAEIAKQQGYATACVGKWHLGHRDEFLPTEQGFDSYYGIPYSNDMKLDKDHARFSVDCLFREGFTTESSPVAKKVPLMRGNEIVEYPADQTTLTKRYTAESVAFIHANADRPFFLYLAHTMVHAPIAASPEWVGSSGGSLRKDVIQELDWSVGQILQAIADDGLGSNTLVIFTSDNGAPLSGLAGQFTGVKGTVREGGVRVPCLMRWPGTIPANTTCTRIAGMIDVLPTVASLIGAELPPVTLDGADISTLLLNPQAEPVRTTQLYYADQEAKAICQGDWKLILPEGASTTPSLFNLAVTSPERVDLSSANPTLVASLLAELAARDAEIKANARPAGKVSN